LALVAAEADADADAPTTRVECETKKLRRIFVMGKAITFWVILASLVVQVRMDVPFDTVGGSSWYSIVHLVSLC
jgi:hypothetical protein